MFGDVLRARGDGGRRRKGEEGARTAKTRGDAGSDAYSAVEERVGNRRMTKTWTIAKHVEANDGVLT